MGESSNPDGGDSRPGSVRIHTLGMRLNTRFFLTVSPNDDFSTVMCQYLFFLVFLAEKRARTTP